jgi:hypothetical protein
VATHTPESSEGDGLLHANGIDALTGLPALSPIPPDRVIERDPSTPRDPAGLSRLGRLFGFLTKTLHGLPEELELKANDPAAVGWAVVFASDVPDDVRHAVEPLIAHRRDHTRVPGDRLKVLEIDPGKSLDEWLRKVGAHRSDVDPAKLPYYVTLIGGPESIPFEHQSELDVGYAVGRLSFDRAEDYRQYAESVIAYETAAAPPNGREVAFWSTRNLADRATQLSADCLVRPLAEGIAAEGNQPAVKPIAEVRGFRSRSYFGSRATRANLVECVSAAKSSDRPAFLFTASHGLSWPKGHELQIAQQGALLCQDWPGLGTPPAADHCLTAAQLGDSARIHGLIAFCFACYGAGTPSNDHFLSDHRDTPMPIAEKPFVAALPRRLLSHPGGGALAVIGHVERAWAYSIRPAGLGNRLLPFRNMMGRILRGEPVGLATKDFSDRYAATSMRILNLLSGTGHAQSTHAAEMAALWVERNDAQNYVLLGDPAVRMRVETMS